MNKNPNLKIQFVNKSNRVVNVLVQRSCHNMPSLCYMYYRFQERQIKNTEIYRCPIVKIDYSKSKSGSLNMLKKSEINTPITIEQQKH